MSGIMCNEWDIIWMVTEYKALFRMIHFEGKGRWGVDRLDVQEGWNKYLKK